MELLFLKDQKKIPWSFSTVQIHLKAQHFTECEYHSMLSSMFAWLNYLIQVKRLMYMYLCMCGMYLCMYEWMYVPYVCMYACMHFVPGWNLYDPIHLSSLDNSKFSSSIVSIIWCFHLLLVDRVEIELGSVQPGSVCSCRLLSCLSLSPGANCSARVKVALSSNQALLLPLGDILSNQEQRGAPTETWWEPPHSHRTLDLPMFLTAACFIALLPIKMNCTVNFWFLELLCTFACHLSCFRRNTIDGVIWEDHH